MLSKRRYFLSQRFKQEIFFVSWVGYRKATVSVAVSWESIKNRGAFMPLVPRVMPGDCRAIGRAPETVGQLGLRQRMGRAGHCWGASRSWGCQRSKLHRSKAGLGLQGSTVAGTPKLSMLPRHPGLLHRTHAERPESCPGGCRQAARSGEPRGADQGIRGSGRQAHP
jgi:hypothetical protein